MSHSQPWVTSQVGENRRTELTYTSINTHAWLYLPPHPPREVFGPACCRLDPLPLAFHMNTAGKLFWTSPWLFLSYRTKPECFSLGLPTFHGLASAWTVWSIVGNRERGRGCVLKQLKFLTPYPPLPRHSHYRSNHSSTSYSLVIANRCRAPPV